MTFLKSSLAATIDFHFRAITETINGAVENEQRTNEEIKTDIGMLITSTATLLSILVDAVVQIADNSDPKIEYKAMSFSKNKEELKPEDNFHGETVMQGGDFSD